MSLLDEIRNMSPEDRSALAAELKRLDEDPEADYQEMTVAEADRFRKQFQRLEPDCRDMILKGLFSIDMVGRELKSKNAELRKKFLLELYCALSEVHQEQACQYVMLLLENQ